MARVAKREVTQLRPSLTLVAAVVVLLALVPASAAAGDDATPELTPGGAPIAYSDTYLRYLALFPQGWAPNYCELAVALSGGSGVCETIIDPVYFYPDGALGSKPWVVDPTSPIGWSIPNPCAGVPEVNWETWTAYVDGTNYPGSMPVPSLTDDQVECGIWTYGWWF